MDTFFDQLVYSASNEDPESELQALGITPEDTVMCITGSGARPLDLLTAQPKQLVAVDFNPRQNWLLELKVAAIRRLTYEQMLAFIGVISSPNRVDTYGSLRPELSPEAKGYWDSQHRKISNGVLYSGVWERYQRWMVLPLWPRKKLIRRLFEAESLNEQWKLWQQHWDTRLWRWSLKAISHPFIWKYIMREPGFEHILPGTDIASLLYQRFNQTVKNRLFRENPFVELLLKSAYSRHNLPLHLQPEAFDALRASIDRLRIVTGHLEEHLQSNPATYSAFSLSDFSSYCDPKSYKSIWMSVLGAAADQARVCERFFLVTYDPERLFPEQVTRARQLEHLLSQTDHSFIYTFGCSTVHKNQEIFAQ